MTGPVDFYTLAGERLSGHDPSGRTGDGDGADSIFDGSFPDLLADLQARALPERAKAPRGSSPVASEPLARAAVPAPAAGPRPSAGGMADAVPANRATPPTASASEETATTAWGAPARAGEAPATGLQGQAAVSATVPTAVPEAGPATVPIQVVAPVTTIGPVPPVSVAAAPQVAGTVAQTVLSTADGPQAQAVVQSEVLDAGRLSDRSSAPAGEIGRSLLARVQAVLRAATEGSGARKVVLVLNPPHLGTLRVEVEVHNGEVSALFRATSEAVRHILGQGLDGLRQALQDAGLHVDRLDVVVDPDPDQWSWHGRRGNDAEESSGPLVASDMAGDPDEGLEAAKPAALRQADTLLDVWV